MRVEFHPEAATEFLAAALHYQEAAPGHAVRFIAAIEHLVAQIAEAPGRFPVIDGAVRRGLVRRFPYAVIFAVGAELVWVLAVMHGQRRPGYWRARMNEGRLR